MSLILAGNFGGHALIATDTYSARGRGEPPAACHLQILSCPVAVIAGRGPSRVVATIAMEVANAGLHFDDLQAILPSIIADVTARGLEEIGHDRSTDVALGGWSDARAGMALFGYHQHHRGAPIETVTAASGDALFAPWDRARLGPLPKLANLKSADGIIAVARRQCALADAHAGAKASGGLLMTALVNREYVLLQRLCDLDAAAEPKVNGFARHDTATMNSGAS